MRTLRKIRQATYTFVKSFKKDWYEDSSLHPLFEEISSQLGNMFSVHYTTLHVGDILLRHLLCFINEVS